MYTPKWFDYSSKSFDELKCINTNARIGFTTFSTCTDPNRPHCAALCVQINNGIKVQLTPLHVMEETVPYDNTPPVPLCRGRILTEGE